MVEPVSSFPYYEYFNLHYSGIPGNFELIFVKDINLLFHLEPRIWGGIEGTFLSALVSLRTELSLIPLSR